MDVTTDKETNCMTNVGIRNRRVDVLEEHEGKNSIGQTVIGYKKIRTVWALIHPLRGKEKIQGNLIESREPYRVTFGYFKGLTESMILKYDGRYFNITSIADVDMQHVDYEVHCLETVDRKIKEVS